MPKGSGLPPHVTGISPNEGTPGIKLTIRGENFGQTASDLTHVFINQIDVGPTAQWFSPKHISAITPLGEGELDIVVVTNGDKFGTASVSYRQTVKRSVGAQTSVHYWPADERRHCPAIFEHAHETGREGIGASAGAGTVGGELDPSTGLPMSERSRISIPISDTELSTIYPVSGSVQLTEKDFDPMLFLLKFYKNCGSNDLTVTYNNFRKSLRSDGPSEPVNVIRTNLVLIFRCLSGMESLRVKLISEKSVDKSSHYELPVEAALSESRNLGHQLFEGILKRKDRVESTRNAIGVMQRYQFLFNLPHSIRTNIAKGDYNLVLNDYLRAKSLFSNSDVPVLRRVYGDVDDVISKFRLLLRQQLSTMPIEFEDAKRKISYLVQLEVDFDPTYECLLKFKDWLIEQAHTYKNRFREVTNVPSQTGTIKKTDTSRIVSRRPLASATVRRDIAVPMLELVKSVCDLFSTHVIQFWRLGAAYVSGKFLVAERMKTSADLKAEPSSQDNPAATWTQINHELVDVLTNVLRDQILEEVGAGSKTNAVVDWLPQCIVELRHCCTFLPLSELSVEIGEIFSGLVHDLRRHAVRGIYQHAQNAVESLQSKENWEVELNDSDGGLTKLPSMYEELIASAFRRCQDQVVPQTPVEKPLFDSAELQERFPDWCGDAMVAFISTLRRLADQIEGTVSPKRQTENLAHSGSVLDQGDAGSSDGRMSVTPQARGLLLLLNNALSVDGATNGRLLDSYQKAGYAFPEKLRARLETTWTEAIKALISRYVNLRGPWLVAPIRALFCDYPQRVTSSVDKKLNIPGAHMAVRCVLTNLAHIFSELALLLGTGCYLRNSKGRVEKPIHTILTQLLTFLVEQIHSSFSKLNLQSISRSDHVQLLLDLQTVQAVLPTKLFTQNALHKLDEWCSTLKSVCSDPDEQRYLERLLDREKSRFRLLIDGFTILEPSSSVIIVRG